MTDRTAEALALIREVHNREAEAGVRTAKKVIFAAANLIACERGPEEARRILRIAIAGQTQVSALEPAQRDGLKLPELEL